MRYVLMVATHTPVWVFAGLAYLVWMGVKGLGTRTLPAARVWTTPAIFIVWGLSSMFSGHAFGSLAHAWFAGMLVGAAPGVLTSPRHIELDRAAGRVRFRGSPFPLIRNLMIFAARYVLGVLSATAGTDHAALVVWSAGVSGASAGYFIGWSLMFWRRLQRTPNLVLATA